MATEATQIYNNPFGAHRNVGIPLTERSFEDERLADEDWAGMVFQDCAFERTTFSSIVMHQTAFVKCRFVDCAFEHCQLLATRWVECTGSGFRVAGGELVEVLASECEFDRLQVEQEGRQVTLASGRVGELEFAGEGLTQDILTLSDCEVGALRAERAEWRDCSAVGMDLGRWSIAGASFLRCSFIRASAEGVDLSTVALDGCNFFQGRLQGARFGAAERCLFAECDLAEADFREARAAGSLFAKAQAHGARFEGAILEGAVFPEADLTRASLAGASAPGSAWVDANLTDANLERLAARGATWRNAVLAGAGLAGADLRETDLHGVEDDLSTADTRGSRGTVGWRASREQELQRLRDASRGD